MRFLITTLVFAFILCSCENKPEEKEKREFTPIEVRDDYHVEYFPGTKKLKIEGPKDENNQRHGMWKSYNPAGVLVSMTEFQNGKKNGVIVVNYDSGTTRYTGEHINDEPSGIWKFYNPDGTLATEKNYDE